jgi:hypothetical protein
MRRFIKSGALIVTIGLATQVGALAQSAKLSDFGAMAGCWENRDAAKKTLISEQWMRPAGDAMLGMGRTVRDGRVTGFEFMRIEERPDGIVFISKPKENKDETTFKLIRSTTNEFVFENPAHDFPQRVIYKIDRHNLTGRIEGKINGKERAVDFPMTRTKCE